MRSDPSSWSQATLHDGSTILSERRSLPSPVVVMQILEAGLAWRSKS
jgi:hypothetical protein